MLCRCRYLLRGISFDRDRSFGVDKQRRLEALLDAFVTLTARAQVAVLFASDG